MGWTPKHNLTRLHQMKAHLKLLLQFYYYSTTILLRFYNTK